MQVARNHGGTLLCGLLHYVGYITSEKINFSYYILLHLIISYSSYFGGKKGIGGNKTSFFLLMHYKGCYLAHLDLPCADLSTQLHLQKVSAPLLYS